MQILTQEKILFGNIPGVCVPIGWTLQMALALILMGMVLASPSARATGTLGLYVGANNEFYPVSTATQTAMRSSGYTTLVVFTLNLPQTSPANLSGDITAFGATLCHNGVYTGDPNWGTELAGCKTAPSSVNRIEFCLGNYGSTSFATIQSLIASQGTGPSSILYQNFLALKNATGADAIQFDDENNYDVNSMVAFGNMLATIGYKVTLCPYTQQAFWVNVKSQLGSKVDTIYLQCYDGGATNDPGNWNSAFGGFKVTPGLWSSSDTIQSSENKFANWKSTDGIPGGFMWLDGSLQGCQAWSPGMNIAFQNAGVYMIESNGNPGLALQGTNDLYLGSGGYVSGCNEVALTPTNGNAQQLWSLIPVGGGYWWVMNTNSWQLLQATGDPYHAHGGANAGGSDKVALTPSSWNLPQQQWLINPSPGNNGFAFQNTANSQNLQSTNDAYWSNGAQNYASGCNQVACTPSSYGIISQDQWNLVFVRN